MATDSILGPGEERERHAAPVAGRVVMSITAGQEGRLWVFVDGADVQQVAARIGAACDVLTRARPNVATTAGVLDGR